MSPIQRGFIRARSVISKLASFMLSVVPMLDIYRQADMIYLDFSKAFDRVCHDILIYKLIHRFRFHDNLVGLIRFYLVGRGDFVKILGFRSFTYLASSGVPQDSNLGPLTMSLRCYRPSPGYMPMI